MEQSRTVQTQGGIGFLGFLAILFIGLKLTGYITWSWWLVLAPLWVPITLVVFLFIAFFVFFIGASAWDRYKKRT